MRQSTLLSRWLSWKHFSKTDSSKCTDTVCQLPLDNRQLLWLNFLRWHRYVNWNDVVALNIKLTHKLYLKRSPPFFMVTTVIAMLFLYWRDHTDWNQWVNYCQMIIFKSHIWSPHYSSDINFLVTMFKLSICD